MHAINRTATVEVCTPTGDVILSEEFELDEFGNVYDEEKVKAAGIRLAQYKIGKAGQYIASVRR